MWTAVFKTLCLSNLAYTSYKILRLKTQAKWRAVPGERKPTDPAKILDSDRSLLMKRLLSSWLLIIIFVCVEPFVDRISFIIPAYGFLKVLFYAAMFVLCKTGTIYGMIQGVVIPAVQPYEPMVDEVGTVANEAIDAVLSPITAFTRSHSSSAK